MDKQSLITRVIETANALAAAATALGDKATWRPLDKGRSAVSQLVECGGVMTMTAQMLREKAFPPLDREAMKGAETANDTLEKAVRFFTTGRDALIAALDTVEESELTSVVITLPFGGGIDKTLDGVVRMCCWNNTYHEGQVNYIQTLL